MRKTRKDKGVPRKSYKGKPCKKHIVFYTDTETEPLRKFVGKTVLYGENLQRHLGKIVIVDNTLLLLSDYLGWPINKSISGAEFEEEIEEVNKEGYTNGWWITCKFDADRLGKVVEYSAGEAEEDPKVADSGPVFSYSDICARLDSILVALKSIDAKLR